MVGDPSTNGSGDPAAAVLAELRTKAVNVHLLRGYGPLVAALIVAALMIVLLPSVAPERVVERPAGTTTTAVQP
jgi:hypothetical protein